jgi:acetolactate synthase regulatory subunit
MAAEWTMEDGYFYSRIVNVLEYRGYQFFAVDIASNDQAENVNIARATRE